MTQDLITWLKARLDEDERIAREAGGDTWIIGQLNGYRYSRPGDIYAIGPGIGPARIAQGTYCGPDITPQQTSAHIALHDPARVLAEVAAKRRILDLYEAMDNKAISADAWVALGEAVKLLAQPYSGHPGWQDDWTVTE